MPLTVHVLFLWPTSDCSLYPWWTIPCKLRLSWSCQCPISSPPCVSPAFCLWVFSDASQETLGQHQAAESDYSCFQGQPSTNREHWELVGKCSGLPTFKVDHVGLCSEVLSSWESDWNQASIPQTIVIYVHIGFPLFTHPYSCFLRLTIK